MDLSWPPDGSKLAQDGSNLASRWFHDGLILPHGPPMMALFCLMDRIFAPRSLKSHVEGFKVPEGGMLRNQHPHHFHVVEGFKVPEGGVCLGIIILKMAPDSSDIALKIIKNPKAEVTETLQFR